MLTLFSRLNVRKYSKLIAFVWCACVCDVWGRSVTPGESRSLCPHPSTSTFFVLFSFAWSLVVSMAIPEFWPFQRTPRAKTERHAIRHRCRYHREWCAVQWAECERICRWRDECDRFEYHATGEHQIRVDGIAVVGVLAKLRSRHRLSGNLFLSRICSHFLRCANGNVVLRQHGYNGKWIIWWNGFCIFPSLRASSFGAPSA